MSERSERFKNLTNFAGEEIEKFKKGEIDRISSLEELGIRFGYSPRSRHSSRIAQILRRSGVLEDREIVPKQRRSLRGGEKEKVEGRVLLTPSRDLAWMLGVLVCGGFVGTKEISLDSVDRSFLEEFKMVGERLLKTNATYRYRQASNGEDEKNIKRVIFYNSDVVHQLGDLRRPGWPTTIIEKHRWILKEQRYSWSFLEGIFERVGGIRDGSSRKKRKINFHTSNLGIAQFIIDLLNRLGVERARIEYERKDHQIIRGVSIENIIDLKKIADNIHSKIPEKEERLEVYRRLNSQGHKEPVSFSLKPPLDDVIHEWMSLRRLLGHTPSSEEIQKLKRMGKTKYSLGVYTRRFGKMDQGMSFITARENLERIIKEREQTVGPDNF